MPTFIDIGPYVPEAVSNNTAYDEMVRLGIKVDGRTLGAARKGRLRKCEVDTIKHLLAYAVHKSGMPLTWDDIFVERD